MSGSISKIQSMVAFPKTKYDNQISFSVSKQDGQIDLKSSYVELELTLNDGSGAALSPIGYRNVVLGQDGLMYNASALFRDASLKDSGSGKSIADTMFVNILSNNLERIAKGANKVVADALYDGKGHASGDGTGSVVSVFNNDYQDTPYAVVKCPLSLLYPGSVGASDLFPQESDLTFRYLLEPQLNVFMRAVDAGIYNKGSIDTGLTYQFENIIANAAVLSASALGTVADFAVGDHVIIKCIQAAQHVSLALVVTVVTPDAGATKGSLTFNMNLSATEISTAVSVIKYVPNTTSALACDELAASGNVITLTNPADAASDIYKGTTVNINYYTLSNVGVLVEKVLKTTISDVTLDQTTEQIVSVTLANTITLDAGQTAIGIDIQPLYSNLTNYSWVLQNAHMVVYRRNVPLARQSKMLVSNFSSVNVAMIGGLNRFQYTLKAPQNAFNTFVFTPNSTNLFSFADTIRTYLISVDDVPLTSIYVDASGSAVHNDNLMRVFANSPEYKPLNLDPNRDKEIATDKSPNMFVGKIFHAEKGGNPQVLPFEAPDRNVKIELVADDGLATETKNVFVFLEKWDQI